MTKWNVTITKNFTYKKTYSTTSNGPITYYTDFFDTKEGAMIAGIAKAREFHESRNFNKIKLNKTDFEILKNLNRFEREYWNGPAGTLIIDILEITENMWK